VLTLGPIKKSILLGRMSLSFPPNSAPIHRTRLRPTGLNVTSNLYKSERINRDPEPEPIITPLRAPIRTGYNTSRNLSIQSRIIKNILPITGVNTNNQQNYMYEFKNPAYNNKSLVGKVRDPTKYKDIYYVPGFGFTNNLMKSYKDIKTIIVPKLESDIRTMLTKIPQNKDFFKEALFHYSENLYLDPDGIAFTKRDNTLGYMNVINPLTETQHAALLTKLESNTALTPDEVNILQKICLHYKLLKIKIGKKGLTLDDYFNQVLKVREIMASSIPETIYGLCPDFDHFNESVGERRLEQLVPIINLKKQTFRVLKYGTVIDFYDPTQEFDLLKYMNIDDPFDIYSEWNTVNPTQLYNDHTQNYMFMNLKSIVSLSYENISCQLTAQCHEFAHQIGAGNSWKAEFPYGLQFSPKSIYDLGRFLNLNFIIDAFKQNNSDLTQGYSDITIEKTILGEFLADFIGIIVLDKYVDTLPDLGTKYEAIVKSLAWAVQPRNTMDEKHPPNTMRLNMIFIHKRLHDIYNQYTDKMAYKSKPMLTDYDKAFQMSLGITGGSSITRRKNRKNRKATHRRRR
jgi:hypothetical protein